MKIAIDGPAGAGKSTVAQLVAKQLGFTYIDTGAMYRALTWLAIEQQVSPEDEQALLKLLDASAISLEQQSHGQLVLIGNREVTNEIRRPEVTRHVSAVAKHAKIREQMVQQQRQLAEQQHVVMDGRDIGTRVLPDAEIKVFLTASIEERAKRRFKEWVEKGYQPDLEQLKLEIAQRDKMDSERKASPLKCADDAVVLDTSGLSIEQAVEKIVDLYRKQTDSPHP
ncbi:cytidylate kinase [Ammoniphilus oxalaticus]|uniref:Cytidylate kinase n=1 Tax=Ammoniphilus oxalaticus TaxID=66863 RepID=A0A419SN54_9BACL|nr:(d)CMP kinase [Ammoniphilus oxalaticus]RKD25683.1 cytidylate kinase [Ammoniphilus oxalaticus]